MSAVPLATLLPRTPSLRLDGRRALVTGAGRGLGLACAAALAEAGAEVWLAARSADEIEAAASALRARGDQAHALVLDVTDTAAVAKMMTPDFVMSDIQGNDHNATEMHDAMEKRPGGAGAA